MTPERKLAELVLGMPMVTPAGIYARDLARKVLGMVKDDERDCVPITTNGRTRFIPRAEPVFLLRGQDMLAADTVLYWASLAERSECGERMVALAREDAAAMNAWRPRKFPDHPTEPR